MTDKERDYFMARRQAILIELGHLEKMLDLERSVLPKRAIEERREQLRKDTIWREASVE